MCRGIEPLVAEAGIPVSSRRWTVGSQDPPTIRPDRYGRPNCHGHSAVSRWVGQEAGGARSAAPTYWAITTGSASTGLMR